MVKAHTHSLGGTIKRIFLTKNFNEINQFLAISEINFGFKGRVRFSVPVKTFVPFSKLQHSVCTEIRFFFDFIKSVVFSFSQLSVHFGEAVTLEVPSGSIFVFSGSTAWYAPILL